MEMLSASYIWSLNECNAWIGVEGQILMTGKIKNAQNGRKEKESTTIGSAEEKRKN
jgi:hypothetical protein